MKSFRFKLPPLILLLILAISLSAAGQTSVSSEASLGKGTTMSTSDWETLRPDGEGFSVLMPKGSTSESGKEPYHKMELNTRIYLSNAKGGPIFAVVSLSGIKSNPAMYSEMQRVNSYVDAFKNLFPAKVRGPGAIAKLTLVGEKTLQGNAGREYRMTIGDLSGIAQVYATRKRFYAIVYLNAKKEDSIQDQFLSSFVLPEKVTEVPPTVASQSPGAGPNAQPVVKPNPGEIPDSEVVANPKTETRQDGSDPSAPQRGKRAPISGGVLNGKAISLPMPDYPPDAKAAGASGAVVIQVTVDEQGDVLSAQPVSGHAALQKAAVNAAFRAKFSPTLLMGEPVKVTGVIIYNFGVQLN